MKQNKINSETILKLINKDIKINNIHIFDEIDSTNEYAKKIDIINDHYDIIISDCQTNGKGRLGRSFYSPSETGLYMSIAFLINPNTFNFVNITSIVSVAVTMAIEKLTNLHIGIKWVNDLYYKDLKIAGILVEGMTNIKDYSTSKIIVGIGINLTTNNFPSNIIDVAGSLNCDVSRNMLISYIINYFDYFYKKSPKEYLNIYKSHSIVIDKNIAFYDNGVIHYGKAVDINNYGELVVLETSGKITILRTGEISIIVKK